MRRLSAIFKSAESGTAAVEFARRRTKSLAFTSSPTDAARIWSLRTVNRLFRARPMADASALFTHRRVAPGSKARERAMMSAVRTLASMRRAWIALSRSRSRLGISLDMCYAYLQHDCRSSAVFFTLSSALAVARSLCKSSSIEICFPALSVHHILSKLVSGLL